MTRRKIPGEKNSQILLLIFSFSTVADVQNKIRFLASLKHRPQQQRQQQRQKSDKKNVINK